MTLRLRHLRLRAVTGEGLFGADIPLADGLMVLRADNSRGKSTAVQSVLYALGLERMITSRPAQAVTAAMRDRLIFDADTKAETPVLESWVSLQVEGHAGETMTLTRWLKHKEFDSGLVRVTTGPLLTRPGSYDSHDYFVGRPGAAGSPRGFHRWLADYIGWAMPELPARDGKLAPLYMEQVFPLLFVEQRRGWAGIQSQMPYFSGVSDVRRRALEFLLNLDVGKLETDRRRLRAEEAQLQEDWRLAVRAFKEVLVGTGMVATRLPEALTVTWPLEHPPIVAESRGSEWIPMEESLAELRREHRDLESRPAPQVKVVAVGAEERLRIALREMDDLRQTTSLLGEDLGRDREALRAVGERLAALQEDFRQHQDMVTLRGLGSTDLDELHGDCPVCHQRLPDTLLPHESPLLTLTPEDTVAYLRMQIQLFDVMKADGRRSLAAKQERWTSLQSRAAELRGEIRALRNTLTASDSTPSEEFISRQVRLGDRIVRLEAVDERFLQLLATLERLAERGRRVRASLYELPADSLSAADKTKLMLLQQSFIEQLDAYDFGSFSDENLRISEEDYLPRRELFDLQADISASDSIRVVWAYLVGLLEVAKFASTNHPGLLVFDEPRQQSTKQVSFAALLRRAGRTLGHGQVIFATSEELTSLQGMLVDVSHTLHAVEGYLLMPVVG